MLWYAEQDQSNVFFPDYFHNKVKFAFILEKKVLHIDRNPFYGGEGASVNLTNLYKLFKGTQEPPKELGHNRDWNIDLIPKFVMSGGKLVKILLKTRVSVYLEWKRNYK